MSQGRITCNHCGKSYLVPMNYSGETSGPFVCPGCQKKGLQGRPAAPQEPIAEAMPVDRPPVVNEPAADQSQVLLNVCPVCLSGKAMRRSPDPDEHEIICTNCSSVLEETIFGYGYKEIDPKFRHEVSKFPGKTFTLPELAETARARVSEKAAKATAAAVESGSAETAAEVKPTAVAELFWQIDKAELAKREQQAKKGVTVDDLLQEIDKKKKKK